MQPAPLLFFGLIPDAAALPLLAEAARAAWNASTRRSRFGKLRVQSDLAEIDATPAAEAPQPFSGTLWGDRDAANALLAALSQALADRGVAHRLELHEDGEEIFCHAHPRASPLAPAPHE